MEWLRSHPGFTSADISLVDDLPAERGRRGVRVNKPLKNGQQAFLVPLDAAISIETALESHEVGALIEGGTMRDLGKMPTIMLGVHMLVEHAKCLDATPDEASLKGVPVPCTVLGGRTAEEQMAARKAFLETGGAKKSEISITSPSPSASHPWGSRWRAFFACLPPVRDIGNVLSWDADQFRALKGTRASHMAARMLRDAVKNYVAMYAPFVEVGVIDGLQKRECYMVGEVGGQVLYEVPAPQTLPLSRISPTYPPTHAFISPFFMQTGRGPTSAG